MVKDKDPPGATKHLRFGAELWEDSSGELVRILKEFPGVKVGVVHDRGKSSENPHIHVWYDGEKVTNQTIRNRLKAKSDIFKRDGMNQQHWSIRNHDSFTEWWKYCWKDSWWKETRLEFYDPTYLQLEIPPKEAPEPQKHIPIVTEGPLRVKKTSMREKFLDHMLKLSYKWQDEHPAMPPLPPPESPYNNPTHEFVYNKLFHFWENAFTIPEGERMLRNAMYVLSDGPRREALAQQQFNKMMDRF